MKKAPILPSPALAEWVGEFARDKAYSDYRLVRAFTGGQARTFIFEVQAPPHHGVRFVLKSFSRSDAINSADAIEREYRALEVFHAALMSSGVGVVCPAPLGANDREWAYLCQHLHGKPLSRTCELGRFDGRAVARRTCRALDIYYEKVGAPYGDFKPSNVLVQGEEVGMIDPTTPDPRVERVARQGPHAPASGDLGYWMYGLAIDTLVGVLRGRLTPKELPRQIVLGHVMAVEAARHFAGRRHCSGFLDEVSAAAHQHLSFLKEEGSPRQQVLAHAACRVVAAVLNNSRRDAASAPDGGRDDISGNGEDGWEGTKLTVF